MQISQDTGAHFKIALIYIIGVIVTAGITTAVLHGHTHLPLILLINLCTATVFFLCYKKRVKSLATHVSIDQDSLICTIGGLESQVPRSKISGIEDSGYTRAPHLIIVSLHDGREIEFFPNTSFGGFGSSRLKKRLKDWLVSSQF
jgi:hypothetical protein